MAQLVTILLLALSVGMASAAGTGQPSDNFCQGCRAMVSFSQMFNSSQHQMEYKELIKNYCELYYPVSTDFQQGPCSIVVDGLYTVLGNMDPVHYCDQVGACGPTQGIVYSLSPAVQKMTPKQGDVVCKLCEELIQGVQSALIDPAIVDQVKLQADEFCDFLKVMDVDKECRQLLNKYLDQAIAFVRNMDPLVYCRSVQLCPAPQLVARPLAKKSSASRSHALNAATPLKPQRQLPTLADFNDFGIETSVLIGSAEKKQQKPAPNCMLCKMIVKEAFHFLRENRTEANIIYGLDQTCKILFHNGDKLDECQSMVKAYTRELVQLLIDETDPEMICMLLEQCVALGLPEYNQIDEVSPVTSVAKGSQPRGSFNLGDLIHSLDPTVKLKSAKICFECKMFIKYMRNIFDEPSSRAAIKSWLIDNLCKSIPDEKTSSQCKRLVDEYADTFFAAVIGSLNPARACAEMGACTRQTLTEVLQIDTMAPFNKPDELPSLVVSPKMKQQQQQLQQPSTMRPSALLDNFCARCELIVNEVDDYLARHPMDKDLSVLIDQVCNKIPERLSRDQCVNVVQMFGAEIAQAVSTMESPNQLCIKINLNCKFE